MMMVGQQLVHRVYDFSEVALAEMLVRREQERLIRRLKDVVMTTASMSVFAAVGLAVCNGSFVTLWTSGKVHWAPLNDWLLGAMLMVFATTRCHTHFVIVTKHMGRMKYIYFTEGVVFVISAVLLVSWWGFAGLFVAAIGCDILFSGIYGMRRTAQFAPLGGWEVWSWLYPPLKFLLCLGSVAGVVWLLTARLPPPVRLMSNAGVVVVCGGLLFWRVGLTGALRAEVRRILSLCFWKGAS
jgi:hypothetical protein